MCCPAPIKGSYSQGNSLFQDKITIFQDKVIQDLKVINQDMCEKAYIYSIDY